MLIRRIFLGMLGAGLVIGSQVMVAETTPQVSAVASQPVHPVLIRNENSPLTRVVVEIAKGVEVRAKSFVFRLDGTDDLGDLESLSLFSIGDKEEFPFKDLPVE